MLKKLNLKICHLAKYYPPMPGGIETHVQTLARSQSELGAKVTVICVNGLDSEGHSSVSTQTTREWDGEVEVIRLGRLLSVARFDFCPEFFKYFWEIVNESYDLIHLHTPNPTMLIAWAISYITGWLTGHSKIPLVITHHSDIIKQQILKYALRPFEYFVYSHATCILTTSPLYIEGSRFLRPFKDRLSYLPLGIDYSSYLHPNSQALDHAHRFQQEHGTPLWLCVGRLVYYKAFHIAIEALTLVPGKLIMIGTGALETELKKLAKQLGVEDRVIWLGHASPDELVGAYHAATAFWFPSNARSEAFGIVQIEAMASGCPVINTSIPCSGVSWVSRHEKEALTVPINDSTALAKAAQRLFAEPQLREQLATGGLQRIRKFDSETMAKRSFKIYEQFLGYETSSPFYPKEVIEPVVSGD